MNPCETALGYIRRGWSPVPVPFRQKGPVLPDWNYLRVGEQDVARFFDRADQNVGVLLGPASGGLTDVDLDCPEALAFADSILPPTPACFGRPSRPRSHRLYVTDLSGTEQKASLTFKDPENNGMLVEVRVGGVQGAQTVFPGSVHPLGEEIHWSDNGPPAEICGVELKRRVSIVAALSLLARHWPERGARHEAALVVGGFFARCGAKFASDAAGIVEFLAAVAGDDELRDRRRAAQDAVCEHEQGGAVYGFPKLVEVFGEKVARAVASWLEYAPDAHPGISEDAIALRFAERHEAELRFVANWGQWLHYDGKRWTREKTLWAFDLARDLCREEASKARSPKLAEAAKSARTVSAIERFARADRRIAATSEQWDSDPWLLNTPDGVIDLQTSRIRPHTRLDYMTKITAVAPGGDCPIWKAHLLRIFDGDGELASYLQRVFGYGLTGITREHALFFAYGKGANGKSATINTVLGIMNEYQRSASMETFTVAKYDRHPTELAGLQGARFVSATETEEGKAWAESRIKMLTGGDKVEARFMRQDFFEYTPQFKLFISGNHKPRLRSVDEATSRRFQIIPFNVTIPPMDRDHELPEKLKREWPGILAWMIEGSLLWQRDGLKPPDAVRVSTSAYFEEEDTVLRWFQECCHHDPAARTASSVAYQSFTDWATAAREYVISLKAFSERLEARAARLGLLKERDRAGSHFRGLRVQQDPF